MDEAYRQARKRGERDRRRAVSESHHPYLIDLESLVDYTASGHRENIGLKEIPLEMVVGTVTKGRQNAFSRSYMPLLSPDTEFARKWSNLYRIQVSEGYRDPILVTEFMHRFYVQEGNKRVSVLKFLEAPTVMAKVVRLYPDTLDTPEGDRYREFCSFWRVCPLYDLEFSQVGSYARLAAMFGQDLERPWPRKTVEYLKQTYLFFRHAYGKAGGGHLDVTPADAMLVYLGIYNQDRLLDTPSDIVASRLGKVWREIAMEAQRGADRVNLVESPIPADDGEPAISDRGASRFFMGKTAYSASEPLRLAFVHEYPCSVSGWTHVHELGRHHVDEYFGGIVSTESYEGCHDPDAFYAAVEKAVAHGADAIFSTSHTLMEYTLRAAVEYPQVRFLNCSIGLAHQSVRSYYGKMYEAKFLLGALAASIADNHRISYYAPVYASGAVSEINAFAIGAALLDPRAKVYLHWGNMPTGDLAAIMQAEGVSVLSGADVAKPFDDPTSYGLHRLVDGRAVGLAMPVWYWGRYYELIVRSLLHGTWDDVDDGSRSRAVSYWYGIESGVVDVRYAPGLPYQTRKLIQMLRSGMIEGSINPFAGELHSQDGVVQIAGFPSLASAQVVEMDWLADNVVGELPRVSMAPEVRAL